MKVGQSGRLLKRGQASSVEIRQSCCHSKFNVQLIMGRQMTKKISTVSLALSLLAVFSFLSVGVNAAGKETKYPVILAHGMAGGGPISKDLFMDDLFLTHVTDACNKKFEIFCNRWLPAGQENNNKAAAFTVTPFQSSDVRGLELADHIENFMATTGHKKVNLVGHSQGGMDIRKASYVLRDRKINGVPAGVKKVASMISISSPHRGSAIPKAAMDSFTDDNLVACDILGVQCNLTIAVNGMQVDPMLHLLRLFIDHNYILTSGDFEAALLQLQYDDYFPQDQYVTGAKAFNKRYGIDAAEFAGSIITGNAKDDIVSSSLKMLARLDGIDGDGYCQNDCDGDGVAGQGDGQMGNNDSDNIVSINSQQMGVRLAYQPQDFSCSWTHVTRKIGFIKIRVPKLSCQPDRLDTFAELDQFGHVKNLNKPNSAQMSSHGGSLIQTHIGVVGGIPDAFDESEFYASIFNFIATKGH